MAVERGRRRRGRRRRRGDAGWRQWTRLALEAAGLLTAALVGVVCGLGRLAYVSGATAVELLPAALAVLGVGVAATTLFRLWQRVRPLLVGRGPTAPATVATVLGAAALLVVTRPAFQRDVASLRVLIGGPGAAQRATIAHQVYAAYRRSDLAGLARILERARVYEPTVLEAATAFGVDAEVLMGVGAAESSFYPRDSADGGRGLFQITAPPAAAVTQVRRRLGAEQLDPLNQRHNAFLAAATLRIYLDQMHGDPFLGLLAYNIGPRNGGLRAAIEQYGARDFVTIQPYLQNLPRDYPIRVLSAALAYRLWRREGRLPRYEDGSNAVHIQQVGIPGLTATS